MDPRLSAVAATNGGFITRAEALDLGWTDRNLAAAVREGLLRHIRQGAYSPAEIYDACDDEGRHVILARAVVARQQGDVALTGISAAAVHGLTLYRQDLSTVHLVRLDRGSSRHESGVRHHVMLDDARRDVEWKNGLPVLTVARTVWEVATMSELESGVCTADSALRLYPRIPAELQRLQALYSRRPGSQRARITMRLANGAAESAGESVSRVLFFVHRLPVPTLQFRVVNGDGRLIGISDFLWDKYRHLGEFDGKVKYGRLLKEGQTAGDVVFDEKRREDEMRGELFGMSRWTFVDLMPSHARDFIARLWREMNRSARLYTNNRAIFA